MRISIKGIVNLVLLCVSAMLFAGCGGGSGSNSSPAPTTGSLKIDNSAATVPIHELYVSLSTSPTWGAIRNTSTIAGGSSWTLSGLAADTYDAKIASNATVSSYYAYAYGFPITVGNTYTLTATNTSYTGSLIVNNTNTLYPITALYVSTTALGGGTNVLSTSIAPGATRQIVNIPSGTYFVRAVQNGLNRDNSGVGIASYSFTTITYN